MGTNFSWGNDEIQLDTSHIEEKIQNNTDNINTLKSDKLDISTFNDYKSANDNKLNNVINELNNSTLINYQGEYTPGTTALLGQVWSYNNDMWLCKVDRTNQTPTVGNDWDLLSAPEIDLSNYYDKSEIDNKLNNKQNIIRNTDTLVYHKWDLRDNISLYKYSNNELVINYNEKLSFIDKNDNRITFYENGVISGYQQEWTPTTNIIRANGKTTIPLNGKRFVHLQGRFTQYTSNTGSWFNFTPLTIDTQNYNYTVRFPIFDWNTQSLVASIECRVNNGNLELTGFNLNNNQTNYYLWGNVLIR